MALALGLDVGTTGVRGVLLADDGTVAASASAEYPLHHPHPLWAEQDPEDWWQASVQVIRSLIASPASRGRAITTAGLSGQMHGAVLLDNAGAVVRPAIIWSDLRTQVECDTITSTVGAARLADLVGNPALPGFTAPKLLWVRRHEPTNWARVRTVLLPKDYVRYRLTGHLAQEISDAAGTLLLDVAAGAWCGLLLEALELPSSLLPPVCQSATVVAGVSAAAAALTGLPPGLPVVGGGADNACAALGSGVHRPGQVSISVGSSGTVVAPSAAPRRDPAGRVHTFNHAAPATWYLMGVHQAAGLSLRWLRSLLRTDLDYAALTALATATPPGAEGLIWLPYLQGERTPHRDALARGVLFGATPRHGLGHAVRAVLEGVAFSLRDSLEIFESLGLEFTSARLTGGGAQGSVWPQIIADVTGLHLEIASAKEGPALGAALLAGVGGGLFGSIGEACQAAVTVGATISPNMALASHYDEAYGVYTTLYPALREPFGRLAKLATPT